MLCKSNSRGVSGLYRRTSRLAHGAAAESPPLPPIGQPDTVALPPMHVTDTGAAAGLWTIDRHDSNPQMADVLAGLDEQDTMLILLCQQLYDGIWDDMLSDLHDRLDGKPHLFEWGPMSDRLEATIRSHIGIIHRLRQVEQTHCVRLTDMIDEP